MLQETLSYRTRRFRIAPVGNPDKQNTPQKMRWSQRGLPSHNAHLEPLQSLSLLPQKRNEEEQCPITENFARAVREQVWVTDGHVSYRGGRGVVTAGRGRERRNMRCCPRKAPRPFPVHLHHQHLSLAPRQRHLSAPVRGVPEKLTEERTDAGNVPAGHKMGDQIEICAPSLLKGKWRSGIQ